MQEFLIRFATTDDAELIADLSRRTFHETFGYVNTKENMDKFMNEQFTREKLIDEVRQPWHVFFLAYLKNEPVGYVKLREGSLSIQLDTRSSLEIARIYSVQHMIGKGVGKKLMQICHDVARQKGKHVLWLGVWKQNQRAIDFYRKWGFRQVGTHVFSVGNDPQNDFVMELKLT